MVLFPYSEDTEEIWNWCFCRALWWCISVFSSKYEEKTEGYWSLW